MYSLSLAEYERAVKLLALVANYGASALTADETLFMVRVKPALSKLTPAEKQGLTTSVLHLAGGK